MISLSSALVLLVTIIVGGLVFYLLWWLLSVAGLPEPFNKVCQFILALIAVVFLINELLGFIGHPLFSYSGHVSVH